MKVNVVCRRQCEKSVEHHTERSRCTRRAQSSMVERVVMFAIDGTAEARGSVVSSGWGLGFHVGGAAMRMPSPLRDGVPQASSQVNNDTPREVHLWR